MNIALQISALTIFALLRLAILASPSIVMAALVLLPTILALGLVRRERLGWTVAVPCLLSAACLVVAGAALPGFTDGEWITVPVFTVLGLGTPYVNNPVVHQLAWIGIVAALGFVAALLWSIVAATLTGRNSRGSGPRKAIAHG
jgi:hypothetical protein